MTVTLEAFESYIEEVRSRSSMVEVVGEFAKLVSSGRNLKCLSPFRKERTASFVIYPEQDSFYDFGSHDGGDVFSFWQKLHSCGFRDAVDALAKRVDIEAWSDRVNGETRNPEHEAEIASALERRWVEDLQTEAATYYHRTLPPNVREFVRDHYGFTDETINDERIGWADGSLFTYLREDQKVAVDRILKTGMFIRTSGGRIFELHEDRITFPYWRRGKSPYLISRRLDGETPDVDYQKAKYKKTLVHSDRHDYVSTTVRNDVFSGEDSVRRPVDVCIITEGKTDRISATQAGWAAISPVTTQFRDRDHDKLIKQTENAKICAIVNDEEEGKLDARTGKMRKPGLEGALKTAAALFKAGRDVRIVRLPRPAGVDKVDLNSFLKDKGPEKLRKLIEEAKPYPQHLLEAIPQDTNPAELGEKLFPLYELIAICSPLAQEGYVNQIAKRFRLPKRAIKDDVAEFKKTSPNNGDPPSAPAAPTAKGGGGGGGNDNSIVGAIHGAISESDHNYYYVFGKEGEISRISNFVLRPTRRIKVQHGEQLCCDIRMINGRVFQDCALPFNAFCSAKDLVRSLQGISTSLAWSAKDPNVQGLVERLDDFDDVPTFQGVPTLGYIKTREGARWVTPDAVLGPDGVVADSKLIYTPVTMPPLATRLDFVGAELPDSMIATVARRVLPMLFQLNDPDVILPILGWFYASSVAPALRALTGHFAVLWIWGSAGTGKSTQTRDVFWRLMGVKGEPFSCSDTQFAMIVNASSSSSIPILLDEMKSDLQRQQYDRTCRIARRGFSGEDETRGRPDRRVDVYHLTSPLCIIGEQMPTDPALRERMVCASPRKGGLTPERRALFNRLTSEPLTGLAGAWVRFVLTVDVKAEWQRADAELRSMIDVGKLSNRVRDNVTVVIFGNQLFDLWAKSMDVDLGERPRVRHHIKAILSSITESEDGGKVKDAADRFLEALSTYAHRGLLQDGREFAIIGGHLCLHLRSCYDVHLHECQRTGRRDDTNGVASLSRSFHEKLTDDSYVLANSKRVRMPRSGSRVRTIVIDTAKIPDSIDFIEFAAQERKWGGSRGTYTGSD